MIAKLLSQFRSGKGFQKYFWNTAYLFGGRAIQMLLSLVVGALMARYLGPADFGIYNYAISYVTIFSTLANLGLGQVVVKAMVNKEENEYELLGTALFLKLGGALFAILLIWLLSAYTEAESLVRMAILFTAVPVLIRAFTILIFYFQAKVDSLSSVLPHLLSLFVAAGLKLLFISRQLPLMSFVYLLSVEAALYSLGLILAYYLRGGRISRWRYRQQLARKLFRLSWPLMFSVVITTFYMQIDQVMIQKILGNTAVGEYAAAVKLSAAWYAVPWIISGSLFPAILSARKRDEQLFYRRMMRLYVFLIYLASVIILLTVIFARPIIFWIFGEEYIRAAAVLSLHIIASIFVFIGFVGGKWLIAEEKQRYTMYNTASGALINVVINFLLIPGMGIAGAALSTLISQFYTHHLALSFYRDTRPVFHGQNRAFLNAIRFKGLKAIFNIS